MNQTLQSAIFFLAITAIAPVLAGDTTQFFHTHPNPIDIIQQGEQILFANQQVGLRFQQQANGFQLTQLYGIKDRQDFLVRGNGASEIFEIVMTLDPIHVGNDERWNTRMGLLGIMNEMQGDAFSIGAKSAESVAWRQEGSDTEKTLYLEWRNIDVGEDKAVLDVTVAVTLRAGDPLSYWRIDIRNRGRRYGLERVYFPNLPLAPIANPQENVLLVPRGRGELVENPFDKNGTMVHGYYSLHFNMQFQALYNTTSGRGIYLGTRDPTPNFSQLEFISRPPGKIHWRLGHFPPNITFANEDFSLPYECVAGPFRGDWFDACQIYRRWALQQSWCRKGPLATRQDIPQWFKEAPLHFFADLGGFAEGKNALADNLDITADHLQEFLQWTGLPLPATVYGWKKYHPGATVYDIPINRLRAKSQGPFEGTPCENAHEGTYPKIPALPGFSAMCQRLRQNGGMVTPYVALELFDQGPTENAPYAAEAKPHITRDLYGALRTWGAEGTWQPCAWTPWWRNRLQETCTLMLQREYVGGFYLDVMQGSSLPCYWTPHGHSAAGGSAMTLGMHELSAAIRDAVKALNPQAITTGENATENMIDVIDGALQLTMRPEYKAPLFAAVYQDYIPRYGLGVSVGVGWRDRYDHVTDEDAFMLECAALFVEGLQIGRIRLRPRDSCLSFQNPEHEPMIEFLGNLVGYYKQARTRKFLAYGQLMRPLTFAKPSPVPELTISTGGQYRHAGIFPVLTSGVFRSADNALGIFVVNAGRSDLQFRADIVPARHGLANDLALDVASITPDGNRTEVLSNVTGEFTLDATLPARGVTMFHITDHSH